MNIRQLIKNLDFKKEERYLIHNINGVEGPVVTIIKNTENAKSVGMDYTITTYRIDDDWNIEDVDSYEKAEIISGPIAEINAQIGRENFIGYNYFKVDRVFVDEKYRRKGVGSTMLDMVEDLAQVNNIKTMYIDPYACKCEKYDTKLQIIEKVKQFIQRKYDSSADRVRIYTEAFARANGYVTHDYGMPLRILPEDRPNKFITNYLYEDYIGGSINGNYVNAYTNEIEPYM